MEVADLGKARVGNFHWIDEGPFSSENTAKLSPTVRPAASAAGAEWHGSHRSVAARSG
jgi:hypothetical protein